MNTNSSHYSSVTENAEKVLASRYYLKDNNGEVIEDFLGMCDRVARAISNVEKEENRANWYAKFFVMMGKLDFLPNTPTLVNAGKGTGLSACYVIPLKNDYDAILNSLRDVSLIFKSGGGTGFNFSWIKLKKFFKENLKVIFKCNFF